MATVDLNLAAPDSHLRPRQLLNGTPSPISHSSASTAHRHASDRYPTTETAHEVAQTEFRSAQRGSRRVVSDNHVSTSQGEEPDKKKLRLSRAFLLQSLGKRSKKKKADDYDEDVQMDGTQSQYSDFVDSPNRLSHIEAVMEQENPAPDDTIAEEGHLYNSWDPRRISMLSRSSKGKSRATSSHISYASEATPESSYSAQRRSGAPSMEPQSPHASTADVDPSQIIRMALSLNESRRLGLPPGQLPAATGSASARRIVSGGIPLNPQDLRPRHSQQNGTHSPELAQDGQVSPRPSKSHSASARASDSYKRSPSRTSTRASATSPEPQIAYSLSAATILRAKKAQAFFELSHEYRRLLQFLPPLQQGGKASAGAETGRAYNPLQYIRNRKIRMRERYSLNGPQAGWDHVDQVQSWVDDVEFESKQSDFTNGDISFLPPWHRSLRRAEPYANDAQTKGISTRFAGDDARSGPRTDWNFDPADLLADAHWLEQDNHKALIENRDGERIFTKFDRPMTRERPNTGAPRSIIHSPGTESTQDQISPSSYRTLGSPVNETTDGSDIDEALLTNPRKHRSNRSRTFRMKQHILGRKKNMSDRDSSVSGSDDGLTKRRHKELPNERANFAPLEKHMNMMLQKESKNNSAEVLSSNTKQNPSRTRRRGGVSEENKQDDSPKATQDSRLRTNSHATLSTRSSFSDSNTGTPRISVDDFDQNRDSGNGYALHGSKTNLSGASGLTKGKSRPFSFGFMHKHGRSRHQNSISGNDVATTITPLERIESRQSQDSPRSSLVASSRTNSHKSLVEQDVSARARSQDDLSLSPAQNTKEPMARFLKGGRIGELVRTEARRKSDIIWKAEPPRRDSDTSAGKRASSRYDTSEDDFAYQAARQRQQSSSSNDLSMMSKYHVQDLPTFRSSNAAHTNDDTRSQKTASVYSDSESIRRQQTAMRDQRKRRRSRFDRLSPLSTGASTDVSPNTSLTDLKQYAADGLLRPIDLNPHSISRSSSCDGVRAADEALNRMLRQRNDLDTRLLPMTGLATIDAGKRREGRAPEDWNNPDEHSATGFASGGAVTVKDIMYVRSILMAAGTKAQALARRSREPREKASHWLVAAAKDAEASLETVARREEHVVAARLLSETLEKTATAFEEDAETFRNRTCNDLMARIEDLREKVGSRYTPEVRSCGDDADALIAKLTTTHTMAIKQVNENIELMLRSRWRRLRWFRRAGFNVLEWVLVGIMWLIWMFVLLIKAFKAVCSCLITGTRWMLWL